MIAEDVREGLDTLSIPILKDEADEGMQPVALYPVGELIEPGLRVGPSVGLNKGGPASRANGTIYLPAARALGSGWLRYGAGSSAGLDLGIEHIRLQHPLLEQRSDLGIGQGGDVLPLLRAQGGFPFRFHHPAVA